MINFDVTDSEWQEVENLTDNSTYLLQSKMSTYPNSFIEQEILFTQNATIPTELDNGIVITNVKFKKRENEKVYIRAFATPINIQIEEV